ncbi:hypothetical protein FNV43_RR19266 [Rhamnella rubrinervis]|uniref:SCP domain-containing protein n=1 Tax=Rhamnella rubrinervis TaxID=2594499 RepID=A0A8K0DZ63_9ROSA|nr:hypothetical protein FNV43_RR17633 [Rhamnella rubrinervis]KAF3440980.1 hypothetical protein FNV43_RR19266 [Rhamnella rubrinervis]
MGLITKSLLLATIFLCMSLTIIHARSFNQNSHQDFIDAHNVARAEIGVAPISWNYTVAAYAKKYANERRKDCKLEHSGGPYGENLAIGYGFMSGEDAVKLWVSEKSSYNYATNTCADDESQCLHYTQVIWRDSVHLGCARVKCDNGWMFVICSYNPPGNFLGQLPY